MVSSTINIDGQKLRVATTTGRSGSRPLLLLNGLGANLEALDPFVTALGSGVQSIRIDMPGTGGSPAPSIPYRFCGLAALTARALRKLGYDEVDVLGVSWGGALAQQFAHQFPDRCRRLVLVSTGTGAFMVPGKLSTLMHLASPRRYVDQAYMRSIAAELYGGRLRTDPDLAARYARGLRPAGTRGYYLQLFAGAGWTSIHWLWRLRQPTLILSGRDDPIVPPINARILAHLIPRSKLHLFNDGHLGLMTSAPELAPLVRSFLAG